MSQEDRLTELLSLVAREITLRQASDVCCGELTLEQFQTLRATRAADAPSVSALAAALRVDVSTMSRNVGVLERNGHLRRTRSAEDGRVAHVQLTAKGQRALETLRCGERDVFQDVHERLGPVDRRRVLDALETLQSCLQGTSDSSEACCAPVAIRRSVR